MASTQTETGSNIWSQLLAESSQKRFVYEPKTVLVLGDRNSGKTSLIASLQDLDVIEATAPHSTPGAVPLHYTYLDIYPTNDTDDVLTRLHIWTLDGDSEAVENHSALLNLALDERSLSNYAECLILITLDFSEPWHLESSLRFWLRVLKNHIETLKAKLSKNTFSTLQRQNAAAFRSYSEDTSSPSDSSSTPLPSKLTTSADPSQTLNLEEESLDSAEPVLGEDILSENLGVPIVVVGCKSDLISTLLSREYHYRDDQELIYIQTTLRRICLQYGASLFYGAARKRVNIDALKEYLTHRLYNFPFKREPVTRYVGISSSASSGDKSVASSVVVDDDEEGNKKYAVLVPTGWDSKAKIDLEFNSQSLTKDPGQPFKEVIAEPKRTSVPGVGASLGLVEEEKAEDDQDFLKRQLELIESKKSAAPTPTSTISATASPPVARPENPVGSPSPSSSPSLVSAARAAAEATGSPSKLVPAATKPSGTPAPAGGAMSAEDRQNEHKVLADFFTTLMNGGRITARTGTAPGTPVGSKIAVGSNTGSPSRTDAEKSMKNLSNRD